MRKRLTEVLPFLLPLRRKQKIYSFYRMMERDTNTYAHDFIDYDLPYKLYTVNSTLINEKTGFDIKYQINKSFNLKLASKCLNRLVIKPNETFSLWNSIRYADKNVSYKEGLTVVNGKTVASKGGGLCLLSNVLFDLFIHSPLTVVERHGHNVKEFPDVMALKGIDATIAEGWLDLKVRNDGNSTFELVICFTDTEMIIELYTDIQADYYYQVVNENLVYYRENNQLIEEVDVVRICREHSTNNQISKEKLFSNKCIIEYDIGEVEAMREEL